MSVAAPASLPNCSWQLNRSTIGRCGHAHTSSGVRRSVACCRVGRLRSRMEGIGGRSTPCGPTTQLSGRRSVPTAFCSSSKPFQKRVGTRRAARHIHIDRQELVHALHHAVDVVHAAGVGARAHGDHPARLHHLLVEPLDDRRHLDEHRAGDHHQIRFARRAANHFRAEARDVVLARDAGGHLDVAAGKAEVERPDGILAPPGDQILQRARESRCGVPRRRMCSVPASTSRDTVSGLEMDHRISPTPFVWSHCSSPVRRRARDTARRRQGFRQISPLPRMPASPERGP